MALDLYRRHSAACKYSGRGQSFTKCSCVIWCYGAISGHPIRKSLRTRDWTIATRLAHEMESAPDRSAVRAMTIADAVNEFLDECYARKLARSTIISYETTLSSFRAYCERRHTTDIRGLTLEVFRGFRASRILAVSTQRKEIEMLRTFSKFCHEHDWIPKNFAAYLKPPKEAGPVTMPYESDEIIRFLKACDKIENTNKASAERARLRARALILLLLYSGLRISDVIRLRRDQLQQDGRLMMRTMKTGVTIYVRLHCDCVAALKALPVESAHFLWSGNGRVESATGSARRTVDCISKISGVKARPHRFRDTFAVELLAQGVDIRTVQLLLGHESIKTTEKHYAPFIARFQQRLDEATSKLKFG
jgi:site-specific recombinase XerD